MQIDEVELDLNWEKMVSKFIGGVMAGPILAVEAGMGEEILILTFVVIVIGRIGSIRGALIAALGQTRQALLVRGQLHAGA